MIEHVKTGHVSSFPEMIYEKKTNFNDQTTHNVTNMSTQSSISLE